MAGRRVALRHRTGRAQGPQPDRQPGLHPGRSASAGRSTSARTTGCNRYADGLDVVLEARAAAVTDEDQLRRLAEAYVAKYGEDWRFEVRDHAFFTAGTGRADVYRVAPVTAFGFARGIAAQTRYRFAPG